MRSKLIFGAPVWVLTGFVLLQMIACSPSEQQDLDEIGPHNILFVLSDDQRYNTIHTLGHTEIITPNMDRLAKEGSTFTNAYIMGSFSGAVCAPSRAMIMTGRSLFGIDPEGNSISEEHVTLPQNMDKVGYTTHHIGKWHNGREAFGRSFESGSSIFFGGMHSHYFVPTYDYSKDDGYSTEPVKSEKHSSELYTDAAIDFLENVNSKMPFFLSLSFQAPHDPREMPEEYLQMYDTAQISLPPNYIPEHPFDNGELDIRDEWLAGSPRSVQEVKANIAAYYAMITHLDAQIGRLMKALSDNGLDSNTIVIFTGDNGLAVGQHGLMGKQNLYEHSIKVPLIFRGPGIAVGARYDAFVYLSDIFPTICEMTNLDIPQSVQGLSLASVLNGHSKMVRKGQVYAYKNFQRAYREGRYKLIKYNVDGAQRSQLFDLDSDPWEIEDLSGSIDYKDVLLQLETGMIEAMVDVKDPADISVSGWDVPLVPAWKDRVSKEALDILRKMAEEERVMRGFK